MPDILKTNNHDIVGLDNRLHRFVTELQRAASANVSAMNTFDQSRVGEYLTALDTYMAWVLGQPQLDQPETASYLWELEEFPEWADVENEEINDLQRILISGRKELINSQSARLPAGLLPFDAARFTAIVAKARAFMTLYVSTITPLDLPASSPEDPQAAPAKTGI